MIDIKELDLKQLISLQENIAQEVKLREQEKFRKLAQNAADALNALRDEYPHVSLYVDGCSNSDEDYYDTNVFDHFDHFEARHFCR